MKRFFKVAGPLFLVAVVVVAVVVMKFGSTPDAPSVAGTQTTSVPMVLPTAPIQAPYGGAPRGTIGDYAVPEWSPVIGAARLDDPRVESYLLQAPPTLRVAGWTEPIPAQTRTDASAFTKMFLHGFYDRHYEWPRAAWASWVWDNWASLSMSPTSAGAAQLGQPSSLYRERAMFLTVAMAPTPEAEDVFAPASQEAWQRLGRMGVTSKVTGYDAKPVTLASVPTVGELWKESDPAAQVFDVRLKVETTTNGIAPTSRDLHLLVFVTTANEAGGFGVQAMVAQ